MAANFPRPGVGFVPEYQVSSIPWVTASIALGTPQRYDFPTVTRFVNVHNSAATGGAEVRFGWSYPGVTGSYYFGVSPQESLSVDVRCTSLFVIATAGTPFQLLVGLTGIEARQMPPLSGSSI